MSLRKILIAAAVAAPLAFGPMQASAQQGRGAEARDQAHQIGGQTATQLPPGIAQRVERGGDVPEGIAHRFAPPAPEPAPAPEPEPEPAEPEAPCEQQLVIEFGVPIGVVDCNGNFFPF